VFGISCVFDQVARVGFCLLSFWLIQINWSLYWKVSYVLPSSRIGSFFQHLSKAVGIVTKSVLTEHLITVASSMTCTGSFNRSGYEDTFQSLKVQVPFTKATRSVSVVDFFWVTYFGAPVPIAYHNEKNEETCCRDQCNASGRVQRR
jgi:hypothetical protein